MYRFHIDAHEGVEGAVGAKTKPHRADRGTGRRGEIMHFGFPQMNKNVSYTPLPKLPYICLLFLKKKKGQDEVFAFSLVIKMSQIKKINAHNGRSCLSKYKLVWPLVHFFPPLSLIHTGISA